MWPGIPRDPRATTFNGSDYLRGQNSTRPGIYYETAGGAWECCPWDEKTHDAAFVFYIHRESQGRMEMALGGFSGRATRLLARLLARRGEETVMARQGSVLVATFHPELTDDPAVHRYFCDMVRQAGASR